MINIEKCKKLLSDYGDEYNSNEIKKIVAFLEYWAELNIEIATNIMKNDKQFYSNKASGNNGKGKF
jgi:hypothetical protein